MKERVWRRLVQVERLLLLAICELEADLPGDYRRELSLFHAKTLSLVLARTEAPRPRKEG